MENTNNYINTNRKEIKTMKKTNRIKTRIIATALSAITLLSAGTAATTSASAAEKTTQGKISSENWMKNIRDDVKITDLNIPGAHDAAMVHSSAVFPVSTYTLTQSYHIGTQTWTDSGFCRSDKKTFGLAKGNDNKKYAIYKDNCWEDDNLLHSEKVKWVYNGLMEAESIRNKETANGYDAFMLNYTSANTPKGLKGPKTYAEMIIPVVSDCIKNARNKCKFYGIIAMDFCDTDNKGNLEKQSFGSDTLVRTIFETNLNLFGV